jgi:hypothetical protein
MTMTAAIIRSDSAILAAATYYGTCRAGPE